MLRRKTVLGMCVILVGLASAPRAQSDSPIPEPPHSMGQPKRFRTAVGVQGGYTFDYDSPVVRFFGNVTPEGYFPSLGIDLMSFEVGLSQRNDDWGADVGYYIRIPYIRTGIEYDFRDEAASFVFTLQFAARRGGLFRHGEEARFDYWGRNKQILAGLAFNTTFWKYRRTRPIHKSTKIPKGDLPETPKAFEKGGFPTELDSLVMEVEHAIEWLDLLLTPRFTQDDIEERAEAYRDHIRQPGHTFEGEDERYHAKLREAFTHAIGGDESAGDELGTTAERIILEQIIVPYDGRFGEGKRPKEPDGYTVAAIKAFTSYLDDQSPAPGLQATEWQKQLAGEVFRRCVVAIHQTAENSGERWRTAKALWTQESRLAWLPLNYGLRPEQYDTQAEWDAVLQELTGQKFTPNNYIEYLINERFQFELKRMILATRDYHVLIVHDFQGQDSDGGTDAVGWTIVADGYMRAMIDAVKAIDAGTREYLPQFMIFIDQNYYQSNHSRKIMTYLERMYQPRKLELANDDIQTHVEETHRELIETIKASPTFGRLDERKLKGAFKVHINVTNPWDPAFAIDVDKRDHRKIAFRDVTEDDPASGEGVLTGTGVGEHYLPPGWEDRAFIIRGPALVALKSAARRLCFRQGFREREIPPYLRERPFPPDYDVMVSELRQKGWFSDVMLVVNDTGYGEKKATVQRAVMYNLAPRASVLLALDSLWLSDFWAEMYIAAALRGAHVYAIAPSPGNAPSSADPTLFIMQETLQLLVAAREYFKDDLEKVGGRIHVGLYAHHFGTDDAVARAQAYVDGVERSPFLSEDFPMNPGVADLYREAAEAWRAHLHETGEEPSAAGDEEVSPYLHMKTQLFATDAGLEILRDEEWKSIVRNMLVIRGKQYLGQETPGLTPTALVEIDSIRGESPMVTRFKEYLAKHPPGDGQNPIYAFTIGSMNQDRRGMLSDGEILAVVAGYSALLSIVDLYGLAASATWLDTEEELETLFPSPNLGARAKRLARYLQDFF